MKAFQLSFLLLAALLSCDRIVAGPEARNGILKLSFETPEMKASAGAFPDTNSFLLDITGPAGEKVYSGVYSLAPKELELTPGEYTVSALSRRFSEPLFEAPQYADSQGFTIEPGVISGVRLKCALKNSGVRLQVSETFAAEYSGGLFYLQSSEGTLVYSYGESRTGWLKPGSVWLEFSFAGTTKTLFAGDLKPREILLLRVDSGGAVKRVSPAAEIYGEGISIEVDTSCLRTSRDISLGGTPETDPNDALLTAYTVEMARDLSSKEPKDVWVAGFIVGGDCTSTSCSFKAPFGSATNLVIADDKNERNREKCLAVQLQQGDIRDTLNLRDNPGNLGCRIYLKGDLAARYYGLPGIKNLKEFRR